MPTNNDIIVTNAEKLAIENNSTKTLPINPTAQGYSGAEVRRKQYAAICAESNSVLALISSKMLIVKTLLDAVNETLEDIDTEMSSTSEKPVQNKIIKAYVDNGLSLKVNVVSGKGLSTEDFTTTLKNKLNGIEALAEVNVIEGIKVNNEVVEIDVNKIVNILVPTTTNDLTNNSGFITNTVNNLVNYYLKTDVYNKTETYTKVEVNNRIPTDISQLTNDEGFITNMVNSLSNYYLKTETYTQAQVNNLINAVNTLSFVIVETLPTEDIDTNNIYLVPRGNGDTNDVYDEYVYVNNNWEHLGSTAVDLTEYLKYTTQVLTDEQKVQARTNIGAKTDTMLMDNYAIPTPSPTTPIAPNDTINNAIAKLEAKDDYLENNLHIKNQLDFEGTRTGSVITFTPTTPFTFSASNNNEEFEIDLLFPITLLVGTSLPYTNTMQIKDSGNNTISIISINNGNTVTVGQMKSCQAPYDSEVGFRWIFDATYSSANNSLYISPTVNNIENVVLSMTSDEMFNVTLDGEIEYDTLRVGQVATPTTNGVYSVGKLYKFNANKEWEDITIPNIELIGNIPPTQAQLNTMNSIIESFKTSGLLDTSKFNDIIYTVNESPITREYHYVSFISDSTGNTTIYFKDFTLTFGDDIEYNTYTVVNDVKVNNSSVVVNGIANVIVPTKTSDITNDSGFITNTYHDSTKQNTLTFDTTPTSSSTNPVTSGGVKDYVDSAIASAITSALGGDY